MWPAAKLKGSPPSVARGGLAISLAFQPTTQGQLFCPVFGPTGSSRGHHPLLLTASSQLKESSSVVARGWGTCLAAQGSSALSCGPTDGSRDRHPLLPPAVATSHKCARATRSRDRHPLSRTRAGSFLATHRFEEHPSAPELRGPYCRPRMRRGRSGRPPCSFDGIGHPTVARPPLAEVVT